MSRSRNGFKALGACALVLGVMAISAGATQAEVGSHWNVNGKAINTELKPAVGAVLENNHGYLLSKALGALFEILCTGMTFEETVLKVEGSSLGKARFNGCEVYLNGALSKPCLPHTGTENDVILTNLLKDLIVLHEGQPVDRFEPETGEIIVTIQTSAECSVAGKAGIPIIGKFFAKDCKNEGTVEKVTHLGEEQVSLTELWIVSKTVEHEAFLFGSAEVFLLGGHEGLKWSATPA